MQHGYDKHSRDPSTRARLHARVAQDDKKKNGIVTPKHPRILQCRRLAQRSEGHFKK
jgi:hypothetical protein